MLFHRKWIEFKKFHNEDDAQTVRALFEREGVRFKLHAFTRETRMLGAAMRRVGSRTSNAGLATAYMSDPGIDVYTFEVHRKDLQKAHRLVGSMSSSGGYSSPFKYMRTDNGG